MLNKVFLYQLFHGVSVELLELGDVNIGGGPRRRDGHEEGEQVVYGAQPGLRQHQLATGAHAVLKQVLWTRLLFPHQRDDARDVRGKHYFV